MRSIIDRLLRANKIKSPTMNKFLHTLRLLEPLALILAAVGLILATVGLVLTWTESSASRHVREATLFVMASELLQKARESDTRGNEEHPTAQVGQVRALEVAIASGVSLQGINAREVRLDHGAFAGADLRHANLWGASLAAVDLSRADLEDALLSDVLIFCTNNRDRRIKCPDLTGANLRNAQMTGAMLRRASLDEADFTGVTMYGTRLIKIDLSKVTGLTAEQIQGVCGSDVTLPAEFDGMKVKECPSE